VPTHTNQTLVMQPTQVDKCHSAVSPTQLPPPTLSLTAHSSPLTLIAHDIGLHEDELKSEGRRDSAIPRVSLAAEDPAAEVTTLLLTPTGLVCWSSNSRFCDGIPGGVSGGRRG
jgi:hypothetical protein